MAYAATITWSERRVPNDKSGKRHLYLRIAETGAGTSSEWKTSGGSGLTVLNERGVAESPEIPRSGTITLVQSTLGNGTGTTIQPAFGKEASFNTDDQTVIAETGSAAAFVHEQSPARYSFDPDATDDEVILFGRSAVDAGSDNVIETLLTIVEGHVAV